MQTIIPKSIFFFCFNFLTLILPSQSRFLYHRCVNGNYTTNSPYQTNLDSVLSSLVPAAATTTTAYGFFNRSAGQPPDTVNAIALCRGDADLDTCRSCINDANRNGRELCPNGKGATVWYDDCMLRYSSETILQNLDSTNGGFIWTLNNIPNPDELYQAIRPMMDRLISEAAGGDSVRKFASGNTLGPGFTRIYALMQCTPDLSEDQCSNCLESAITGIPNCCNASLDVRILFPSCNLRYSNSRFFNDTVVFPPPSAEAQPLSPPPSSPPSSGKSSNTTIIIIAVVATICLVILVSIFIFVFIRRRRRSEGRPLDVSVHEHGDIDEISTAKSLKYSFAIVRSATNNFSDENKLGHGGFGVVYKGKLQNGKEIAVKRLGSDSGQGEEEFMNEVSLLAKLQHRNLVRLLGFSLEGSERLLIYEFVQNSSLDKFIFDPTKRATLDWERRYKIIGGIARGLLYLHEDSRLKIIHRDMKASNVLLDDKMIPKIADFGMARLFTPEETQANTCRVVGTYGYMAPEYALHGLFSVKSDVFSFGVLLLEIVTGHNNHSFQNGTVSEDLLSHTWKSWKNGTTSNLIDPTVRDGSDSIRDMIRCIHIGLLCVQEEASDRPTMASVVLMLSSSSLSLAVPSEPAFYVDTSNNPEKPLLKDHSSRKSHSNRVNL